MAKSILEQIGRMASSFDQETLTKKDFDGKTSRVLELVKKMLARQQQSIADLEEKYELLLREVADKHNVSLSDLKKQTNQLFVGEKLNEFSSRVDSKLSTVRDGKTPTSEEIVALITPLIPEPLKGDKGDEGIAPSILLERMSEIEEQNKKLREATEKTARIQSNRSMGRARVPAYKRVNLTSQVDGKTRTFALGHRDVTEVLGIWGSQFPFTGDDVDFALVGSNLELRGNMTTPEGGQTLWALVETLFHG